MRTVKLLRGDAKYRQGVRKLELHSIKNLHPLELSITHNYVVDSTVDQNLLDLEVEDLSNVEDPDSTNLVNLGNEVDTPGPKLKYTYNLEPEELQAFQDQDIAEPVEECNSVQGTIELTLSEVNPTSNERSNNISSRGRVRKPTRKPLDNEFFWETNSD